MLVINNEKFVFVDKGLKIVEYLALQGLLMRMSIYLLVISLYFIYVFFYDVKHSVQWCR